MVLPELKAPTARSKTSATKDLVQTTVNGLRRIGASSQGVSPRAIGTAKPGAAALDCGRAVGSSDRACSET